MTIALAIAAIFLLCLGAHQAELTERIEHIHEEIDNA